MDADRQDIEYDIEYAHVEEDTPTVAQTTATVATTTAATAAAASSTPNHAHAEVTPTVTVTIDAAPSDVAADAAQTTSSTTVNVMTCPNVLLDSSMCGSTGIGDYYRRMVEHSLNASVASAVKEKRLALALSNNYNKCKYADHSLPMRSHTHIYIYIRMCVYVCMCQYVCVCVWHTVCMYVYVYMYISIFNSIYLYIEVETSRKL